MRSSLEGSLGLANNPTTSERQHPARGEHNGAGASGKRLLADPEHMLAFDHVEELVLVRMYVERRVERVYRLEDDTSASGTSLLSLPYMRPPRVVIPFENILQLGANGPFEDLFTALPRKGDFA